MRRRFVDPISFHFLRRTGKVRDREELYLCDLMRGLLPTNTQSAVRSCVGGPWKEGDRSQVSSCEHLQGQRQPRV